jgi:hypothetical protein
MLRELLAEKCACGAEKQVRRSFCGRCYYALTEEHRRDLYQRMGSGYEAAYDAAIAALRAKGRIVG